jgi:hypothetical protein
MPATGPTAWTNPDWFAYRGPILNEYTPGGVTSPTTNVTLGQSSLYFQPFDLPEAVNAQRLNLFLSVATTISAGNSTGRGGYAVSAAIYTRGTGTGSDRIGTLWSGSAPISMSMTSNTAISYTYPAGVDTDNTVVSTAQKTLQDANASTFAANSIGGFRVLHFPIQSTLSPGRYWMAIGNTTVSSNAGVCVVNCSFLQQSQSNNIGWAPFGTSSSASGSGIGGVLIGAGTYSAQSAAFPATVALTATDIKGPSVVFPVFNFSGATTSVNTI